MIDDKLYEKVLVYYTLKGYNGIEGIIYPNRNYWAPIFRELGDLFQVPEEEIEKVLLRGAYEQKIKANTWRTEYGDSSENIGNIGFNQEHMYKLQDLYGQGEIV